MKYYIFILLLLFFCNITFGQTTSLKFSNSLDKLHINKTKERSVIKTFGKADSTLNHDILANIGGGCLDFSYTELIYSQLGLKLKFNGHYKRRQKRELSIITILEGPILLNETIKVGKTTMIEIKKCFGSTQENIEDNIKQLSYNINRKLVVFNLDSADILKCIQISSAK